jgi:formylglycine-generating enzyme required for sulfatase activity
MTPDLQKIYSNCVLKKDWRGAVQILKVALDRESGDSEAMRQLSDMRGLFYIEAGALIREAEICVSGGNQNDSLQIIKRLDERFPEWVELSDSNDVLTALWNVKFAKPVAASAIPSDPKVEDPEQVLPSMEIKAEKSLKELLERAEPTMLTSVKIADLRQLETLFVEADHGFVLGVKSGTVTKKQITDGLARVRAQIEENGNRSVVRNFMVLLGFLILTGIGVWLLKARKEPDLTVPTPVPIPSLKGKLSKELCNPHESNDDFPLPMPEDGLMVFRRIVLPTSKNEGERSSFFEFSATNEGSEKRRVYAPFEVAQERCYFLGKYEVTEGQYDAIMSPSSLRANAMPMRNVTFEQARSFCLLYTEWLQKQYRDVLPKTKRKTMAVIRLAESAEWEFAARGGNRTYRSAEFAKRFPYADVDLNRYEWFGGDKASNNHVHSVGERKPNVLGCYDLLGNVREITRTKLLRGGIYLEAMAARGGDAWTAERDVSVTLETEHPLAALNGGPFETERHGFRVVISTSEPDWEPQRVPSASPGGGGEAAPKQP